MVSMGQHCGASTMSYQHVTQADVVRVSQLQLD